VTWREEFKQRYRVLSESKKINSNEKVIEYFKEQFNVLVDDLPNKDLIQVQQYNDGVIFKVGNSNLTLNTGFTSDNLTVKANGEIIGEIKFEDGAVLKFENRHINDSRISTQTVDFLFKEAFAKFSI